MSRGLVSISSALRRICRIHIHHGFWRNGESPDQAQVHLLQELADRARIQRGPKCSTLAAVLADHRSGWRANLIAQSWESRSVPYKSGWRKDVRDLSD